MKPIWYFIGLVLFSLLFISGLPHLSTAQVNSTTALIRAINEGQPGAVVRIAAGTFVISSPLKPKAGMVIRGAGRGQTIIQADPDWKPNITSRSSTDNPNAYLVAINRTDNVTLSDLTLTGPTVLGAVFGRNISGLTLSRLEIKDFRWSGIRTLSMKDSKIHDSIFVDAGGERDNITGGAVYTSWVSTSEFWNNKISKTPNLGRNFYGFKGEEGKQIRIHHNDVGTNFSIEFAHRNDVEVEISYNRLRGTVSIPKWQGGAVPAGSFSFHIHHNWLLKSYSLEWARNGAEIDHNLFDFETEDDGGNLISNFGDTASPGPTRFHDNLIKNIGRGVIWSKGIYNNFFFYNNHIRSNTTTREDGFFGFPEANDFSQIAIENNIIENTALRPRPLVRNTQSYQAKIRNNTLVNISDANQYSNPATNQKRGLTEPLFFKAGVNDELTIDGWEGR